MKNIKKILLTSAILSTFASANSDIASKITNYYNLVTNNALNFEAIKKGNGYDIKIIPVNAVYKMILNQNAIFHLNVDEGPLITSPKMTFGKAGLKGSSVITSIFNKKIQDDISKNLKNPPKLNYEAIVSFGSNLNEKITIEPFKIDDEKVSIQSSKVLINTDIDLDKSTGKLVMNYDNFTVKPKDEKGIFKIEGLKVTSHITEPPVDGILLYGDNSIKIKNIEFEASKPKRIYATFTFNGDSYSKKVGKDMLDLNINLNASSNNVETIALAKGIKKASTSWLFKNLGSKGIIDLMKLTKKMQNAQNNLVSANKNGGKEKAYAQYMATMDELNNKMVDVINKTFITNKTKIIANLELTNDKTSFVKLDLLYKGKPLTGSINSAYIGLVAQGLAVVDGDIEIKLDKTLTTSVNPFALIVLDMLKNKGFASEKNGMYHFKGKVKDGNIIINNKSYTLQEFSKALF